MISKRLAAVFVFLTLIFVYAVPQAFSDPYWLYDGQAYAKVIWADGTPSSPDQEHYGPAVGSVVAAVTFADGHAQSGGTAASVSSLANGELVGLPGDHYTLSSGRAAATIYGLVTGSYTISFDYTASPKVEGLLSSIAHAGYEMAGASQDLEGSGHFSTIVNANDWISFYASCQTNAISGGSIDTSASISNITVEPYNNNTAAPIPGAAWLLGPGLVGLVGLRRRLRK